MVVQRKKTVKAKKENDSKNNEHKRKVKIANVPIHYNILLLTIVLTILKSDLMTKYLTHKNIIDISILPFLSITTVRNYGAGFGILQNQVLGLIIVSIVMIAAIIYLTTKLPQTKRYALAMGLLLAGAIGNLIDRIFFGYVRDFINFHFFPVFNIADASITLGVLLFIYLEIFSKKAAQKISKN